MTISKAADLYLNEETSKYFFVCFHCGNCFETAKKIIEHIETHYDRDCSRKEILDKVTEQPLKMEFVRVDDGGNSICSEICIKTDSNVNDADVSLAGLEEETDTNRRLLSMNPSIKVKCPLCDMPVFTNEQLLSHLIKTHQNKSEFQCFSCSQVFKRQNYFERHLSYHVLDDAITHDNILEAIHQILGGYRHSEMSTGEDLFIQSDAEKEFSKNLLDIKPILSTERTLSQCSTCRICHFDFTDQNHLDRHLENHRKYFECKLCHEFLETPARLVTHSMSVHEKLKKPKCEYCHETFKTYDLLEQHLYDAHIATKDVTHFDLISSLTDSVDDWNHLLVDHNIKPEIYQCDLCKNEFYSKLNLTNHMLMAHIAHIPSKCDQCDSQFIYKSKQMYAHHLEHSRVGVKINEWDEGDLIVKLDKFVEENVSELPTDDAMAFECKLCFFKCKRFTIITRHIYHRHIYKATFRHGESDTHDNWNLSFNNPITTNREDEFKCDICGRTFSHLIGRGGLSNHIKRFHSKRATAQYSRKLKNLIQTLKCDQCELEFRRHRDYHAHYLEHMRIGPKIGPWNKKVLAANLARFVKDNSKFDEIEPSPYTCTVCGAQRADSKRISTHIRNAHIVKVHTQRVSNVLCPLCGQMFPCKYSLKQHQVVHTQEKKYSCSICSKNFTQAAYVKIHERIHSGQCEAQCDLCGKAFITKNLMRQHRTVHDGTRAKCALCEKFILIRNMKEHCRRVHRKDRPFTCSICSKSFKIRHTLNNHMNTHDEEKKFLCRIPSCNLRFATSAARRGHEKTKHETLKE